MRQNRWNLPKCSSIALACFLAWGSTQPAVAKVVISQLYGGGGNSGATLKNDFIELFNAGNAAVTLDGWSVQYASASGNTWQRTALSGTVQPGQYYLIQEAMGAGGSINLPTPDATGTIPMSASSGKVALVRNTTALTCAADCASQSAIEDLVGFGSANGFETVPAPGLSNTTAALRKAQGCTDTDNNNADFDTGAPNPRNSATTIAVCSDNSGEPGNGGNPGGSQASARIRDIQGKKHRSPLEGQAVSNVPGLVTLVRNNGFYMQDPAPDSDPLTSEGIFVFTSSAPGVEVGDAVQVSGTVSEFRPGGSGGATNLTTTQISKGATGTVVKLSSGHALPAPVVLGNQVPTQTIWPGVESDVELAPELKLSNGLDFYESLEGMRLQLNQAVATGPSNDFGEISLIADFGVNAGPRSVRGGVVIRPDDFNPERIILDDGAVPTPPANVGDWFPKAIGVLDYSFGNFKLLATELDPLVKGNLQPETTRAPRADELTIGSFNVENLSPKDSADKFKRLAQQIVGSLRAPDIVGLMEVQDNDGPDNTAVVDAAETYQALIAAIQAAGGPSYTFRQVNPADDQDGGQPGGNIRVGFLINPAKVGFVDRAGGGSTASVDVVACGNQACLSASPARIQATEPAFDNSRKPLVGEFIYQGNKLFVIANHFNSKGGDQPLFGRFQPPQRSSEVQRNQQAQIVADFVKQIKTIDADAKVVVLGDLNDFQFSDTLAKLKAAGLTDLVDTLPENERYTYVFDGNSQALDHIMVSDNLAPRSEYDIVHVNSEFADQTSDHEPELVRVNLPLALVNVNSSVSQKKSGLSYNLQSKTYNGTLTLTATQALAAPLYVVISGLPAGVTLANAEGQYQGQPYVKLDPAPAAGGSASLTLKFANPQRLGFTYTATVHRLHSQP